MKHLLLIIALTGCGQLPGHDKKSESHGEPLSYEFLSTRLLSRFVENGYVVSRHPSGEPDHQGEGLLWSGIALDALRCEDGNAIEDSLIAGIVKRNGALVRTEPLLGYEGKNEITLDGALGLYRGIASRAKRCKTGPKWAEALSLHAAMVDRLGGAMNPNAPAKLGVFAYVLDSLVKSQSINAEGFGVEKTALEVSVISWAFGVIVTKNACYRLNLTLLAVQTLDDVGDSISSTAKKRYCNATRGGGIATIERYCGRPENFVAEFKLNEWEYAHQRCKAWETPDGAGLETPALDLLTMMGDH